MLSWSTYNVVHPTGQLAHNRGSVDAALLQPLQALHCRQLSFQAHVLHLSQAAKRAGLPEERRCWTVPRASVVASDSSTAAAGPISYIQSSVNDLQQLAANLTADPNTDGLLTAYQQLCLIQKQVLQEQRKRQTAIARTKWRSLYRSGKGAASGAPPVDSSDEEHEMANRSSLQDAGVSREAAELLELKQLRQRCDDAQDFLVSLIQAHLQDEPPAAATRLLTAAAYRQLNIAAINRTCVNIFLEKQADAGPSDMAALMAALALVRCCSKGSHGVEGLGRGQLAALFGGTMTHLVAYVERLLHTSSGQQQDQQDQQLQQQDGIVNCSNNAQNSTRRRRRQTAAATSSSSTASPTPAVAATTEPAVDCSDLRRQVAAGVAAHVSGRVPLNSALISHILQLLGDEAPTWLHPITELQSATSVKQLQNMISHPSRYDYTYLAAALHKLSELVEQQQQHLAVQAAPDMSAVTAPAELARASRLAQQLYGRLQQLQADATSAEIVCVLAAAAKMGVTDGKAYATAATQFVEGPQLQQATDVQVASVMYAVAVYSSSSSSGGGIDTNFSRQQQQQVLKQCVYRMCMLIKEQQHVQGSPINSTAAPAASNVDPANIVMAVWALATARVQMPRVLTGRLFNFLAEPSTVQTLLGGADSSSSSMAQQARLQSVAQTSCSVIWAAAQAQQPQVLPLVQTYLAAFLQALPVIPVACTSITTVLQSLAAVLAAQHQQQQEGQTSVMEGAEADHWRAVFLRCSDEAMRRLQQAAAGGGAVDATNVTAACQLVWAHQVSGITLPDTQLMTLLSLLGKQTPPWFLEIALSRAGSPAAILHLVELPAAAHADLACIGAAFKRLTDLKAQHEVAASIADATVATGPQQQTVDLRLYDQQVKECARNISMFAQTAGIPDLKLQVQQQQEQDPGLADAPHMLQQSLQQHSSAQATASAAANILLATSQLQHRDTRLCSSCMQLFHTAAAAATPEAAAAVVSAMAAAGRKLPNIYRDQGLQTLQEVLRACTSKLLAAPLALVAAQQESKKPRQRHQAAAGEIVHAFFSSGNPADVLLAQNVLQLHAVLGVQLAQQQLPTLLAAAADEAALAAMQDKHAVAALVGSLSAIVEMTQVSAGLSAAQRGTVQEPAEVAAAAIEQQQLLQELLMYGLLPRIASATAKQIATSLEAVAELAVGPANATAAGTAPVLELSMARDYARALFADLLASADTADGAAGSGGSSEAGDFLLGWKGEHVARVAVAAMRLDVACPAFFAAVEADLLIDAVKNSLENSAASAVPVNQQQQQQRRKSRVQSVQLQHLVTVCCAAAALHCRVEGLLAHSLDTVHALLVSQAVAAVSLVDKQHQQHERKQGKPATQQKQKQQVDITQVMLLAWCVAEMDAPQLQQQAEQLIAALADNTPLPVAGNMVGRQSSSGDAAVTAATAASRVSATRVPNDLLFGTAGLAARIFQLHVWLADRQVQAAQLRQRQQHWLDDELSTATADAGDHSSTVAGVSVPAAEVEFGLGLGLSDILSQQQLQRAGQQWLQMQITAASPGTGQQLVIGDWRLAAVAEALQQLPGVEGLSAVTATADGWVRLDLEASIRGVPVAILLLNDSDEEFVMGGVRHGARHLVPQQQQQQQPGAIPTTANGNRHSRKLSRRQQQDVPAASAAAAGQPAGDAANSSSSTVALATTTCRPLSTYELLQESLAYEHVGDVMFRARALAARGYWVVVVSWQEWCSLGGDQCAELAYLQDKLWLLLQDPQEAEGQERVSTGVPVAAAAAMMGQQGRDADADDEE